VPAVAVRPHHENEVQRRAEGLLGCRHKRAATKTPAIFGRSSLGRWTSSARHTKYHCHTKQLISYRWYLQQQGRLFSSFHSQTSSVASLYQHVDTATRNDTTAGQDARVCTGPVWLFELEKNVARRRLQYSSYGVCHSFAPKQSPPNGYLLALSLRAGCFCHGDPQQLLHHCVCH
jgi:hypothetical protein